MTTDRDEDEMAARPRLLIVAARHIPTETIATIRAQLDAADRGDRHLIFDEGVTVHQLIDGRWCPLSPGVTAP